MKLTNFGRFLIVIGLASSPLHHLNAARPNPYRCERLVVMLSMSSQISYLVDPNSQTHAHGIFINSASERGPSKVKEMILSFRAAAETMATHSDASNHIAFLRAVQKTEPRMIELND